MPLLVIDGIGLVIFEFFSQATVEQECMSKNGSNVLVLAKRPMFNLDYFLEAKARDKKGGTSKYRVGRCGGYYYERHETFLHRPLIFSNICSYKIEELQ